MPIGRAKKIWLNWRRSKWRHRKSVALFARARRIFSGAKNVVSFSVSIADRLKLSTGYSLAGQNAVHKATSFGLGAGKLDRNSIFGLVNPCHQF
jgi:hypothetical protein